MEKKYYKYRRLAMWPSLDIVRLVCGLSLRHDSEGLRRNGAFSLFPLPPIKYLAAIRQTAVVRFKFGCSQSTNIPGHYALDVVLSVFRIYILPGGFNQPLANYFSYRVVKRNPYFGNLWPIKSWYSLYFSVFKNIQSRLAWDSLAELVHVIRDEAALWLRVGSLINLRLPTIVLMY
jgi:hypothetical protein